MAPNNNEKAAGNNTSDASDAASSGQAQRVGEPLVQQADPLAPVGITPVSAPPLGESSMGPPPPGMSPIGTAPMHLTPAPSLHPPATSPAQLHAAGTPGNLPRQPMLTPSAPIPMMQQAQALMRKPAFMDEPKKAGISTRTKMIIAAVAGLLVAGAVVTVLVTRGGSDGDSSDSNDSNDNADHVSSALSSEAQAVLAKMPADERKRIEALPVAQRIELLDARIAKGKQAAAKPPTPPVDKPVAKPPVSTLTPSSWNGRKTFVCKGNGVHVLRNIKANTGRRIAIVAKNGCTLYCVDCTIVSRNRYAIRAHNTSKVYLVNGKVIAKKYALYALHAATIVYAGTKIRGRKKHQHRSKIRKLEPDQVQIPE